MRGSWRLVVLSALTVAAIGGAPAVAAAEDPEQTVTLMPPGPEDWSATDPAGNGLNQDYDAATGEPCDDAIEDNCDTILLHADLPGFWDTQGGVVEITLDNFTGASGPSSDFDLYIYESDAAGTRGDLIDDSAELPGSDEAAEIPKADGYYLIQVVYFQVIASSYDGHATIVTRPEPPPEPPDVDDPPGLQDVLASDPSLGYLSHSEPHVAQSPTNPDLLIAGSKQYNRDADSLDEYEFKIGTYVSFDRGRSWTDLGQTDVCPLSDAPPDSWPNNDCYPEDIPGEEGTGPEDGGTGPRTIDLVPEKLRDELEEMAEEAGVELEGGRKPGEIEVGAGETRGSDYGEEYITSDVWVQFDDEGNAYLMLLDSPPYDHGNGWGMSSHRWETPSPQDVQNGSTWSKKIPINGYSQDVAPFFLDDKNTFAVNNAGPDGDGQTGPMVACWGQNIPDAIKQQTVCERSTDGGRSWPGSPVPISNTQQLVIGVSVVADNVNPNRFYATWLDYASQVAGAPAVYEFAQSLDGGASWTSPPTPITTVEGLPTQFPGNDFRNLSIPIMAAGPAEGELYLTYSEYLPATGAGDFDGMQADVRLVKSTNGLTWSTPMTVNPDPAGANHDPDQFQPTVAVTPEGQVNIAYFDRRQDPDNFYIDTYLSRSNDAGQTFAHTRVSHDMWDPRINPPTSPSGAFIGDYQGLVADSCNAIPFFNDTHLANDPDPGFDDGQPPSDYQEVFSWRVPNTALYGGQPVSGVDCTAAPQPDFDGDGVPDSQDQCPNQAGSPSNNGCPAGSGGGAAGAPGSSGAPGAAGGPCFNRVAGGRGSNRLRGTPQGDRILGGRGNDKLIGGAGPDCLFGGPGRDKINARDGERDVVSCGHDRDWARADKIDKVQGCEKVRRGRKVRKGR